MAEAHHHVMSTLIRPGRYGLEVVSSLPTPPTSIGFPSARSEHAFDIAASVLLHQR